MNIIKMHWYKTRKAKGEEPQAQAYQFLEMFSSQQLVTVLPVSLDVSPSSATK